MAYIHGRQQRISMLTEFFFNYNDYIYIFIYMHREREREREREQINHSPSKRLFNCYESSQ